MLVPGAEPTGPSARYVHPSHDRVLATDVAYEFDRTIDEHPPEVRVLALPEEIAPRFDAYLGTGLQ